SWFPHLQLSPAAVACCTAPPRDHAVLHPSQFKVNQTWIAFKMNDVPIRTLQDGDLDIITLMDAGSCFILGSVLVPATRGEASTSEAVELLKQAQAHKGRL